MSRLANRLLRPRDMVDSELGVGLVYPLDDRFQRLDLWLADHPDDVPFLVAMRIEPADQVDLTPVPPETA